MQKVTVLNNQSLLDIVIQTTGEASNLLLIALANDMIPTNQLVPGQEILIPETIDKNIGIVRYYEAYEVIPATALSEYDTQIINNDDPCDICKYFQ